jgi:CheY-like chemotaxis protein
MPWQIAGKKILVVDDNETNRMFLTRQLLKWGTQSIAASSGMEALNYLHGGMKFDVAIIDMQMPKMDGLMLAEEIRKSQKDLPIILLTSHGERYQGQNLFAEVMNKPLKFCSLKKVLISIFNKYQDKDLAENKNNLAINSKYNMLRVLVAEDNVVNQKVATRLLQKIGFVNIDLAINGLEAYEKATKNKYDIILMDCQMPEMDGYEATKKIREFEKEGGRRNIIIAQTAHSFKSELEQCLAVGMDDYISKPFKPGDLRKIIEKYIKQ